MSVAYRSTCRPTIGHPLSVDIATNISVECRSTYRPMLDRHVGRYIDRKISVDISTDTRPICRPIHRSSVGRYVDRYIGRGVHKIHIIQVVNSALDNLLVSRSEIFIDLSIKRGVRKLPQSFCLVEVGTSNNQSTAFGGRFDNYVAALTRIF